VNRFGIHIRLFLAVILLITATTVTLGYMGVSITRRFVQSRFEARMLFLARYLALNSELGILIGEQDMLNRLAENLLSEKDVVRVFIHDRLKNPLTDVRKNEAARNSASVFAVEVPVTLSRKRSFPWGVELDKDSQLIGSVKIEYSAEGINQLLSTLIIRFLLLSIGIACLCVFIFYFISRSIVAPVTRLADAARQVAGGNLKLRVQPVNPPETRELGLAFNAMLEFIETSQNALRQANEEIVRQKTLAELGKFSLMVAHEVKNPLSIIKSALDLLKRDMGQPENSMPIVYIEDEIERLNTLIEEFLRFARPAAPVFRSVDLNAMLTENIVRFEVQLDANSIQILSDIPETPCRCEADPDLLKRAIGNLLKNAVEANDRKGVIAVKAKERDGFWQVDIQDQGPGIPPENMQKIFEPFFTTRAKGSGLGLAFASQVVTAHGGRITAENINPRPGARFMLELPVHRCEAAGSIEGNPCLTF